MRCRHVGVALVLGTTILSIGAVTGAALADRQAVPAPAGRTQVVLLGTGNLPADPDRSGPATAVVVNNTPYLVDFGAGVVRRAKSAAVDRGIAALEPVNLRVVFATHLHSDHTVGYPDLILTPWVIGRRAPRRLRPERHQGDDRARAGSLPRRLRHADEGPRIVQPRRDT